MLPFKLKIARRDGDQSINFALLPIQKYRKEMLGQKLDDVLRIEYKRFSGKDVTAPKHGMFFHGVNYCFFVHFS